jgi:hypothetical protein
MLFSLGREVASDGRMGKGWAIDAEAERERDSRSPTSIAALNTESIRTTKASLVAVHPEYYWRLRCQPWCSRWGGFAIPPERMFLA